MQGTFLFDQLNDVVYFKTDEALQNHLLKLCLREGLVQQDMTTSESSTKLNSNALVQLFSPLVTSQRVMLDQFNNPYTAIHTQDGTIMTFAKKLGFLFVAVGTERVESLAIIQRRLHVFVKLVNLICGPVFNLLKPPYSGSVERQRLLDSVLDKWEELRKEEIGYQIEAVEKLMIDKYLTRTCWTVLETVAEKIQRSTNDFVSHAFLLVNTKLLALFSGRNTSELVAGDLLSLTMLAHTHHPMCRLELPHSPRHSPIPGSPIAKNCPIVCTSSNRLQVPRLSVSSVDDCVSSSISNVTYPTEDENKFLQVPLYSESEESSDAEFYSPCGSPSLEKIMSKLQVIADESNEVPSNHDDILEEGQLPQSAQITEYSSDVLFLQNATSSFSPHQVYTVKIMDGVVLIVVCDVGKSALAGSSVDAINTLYESQLNKQPTLSKQRLERIESNIKRIVDSTKKLTVDSRITRNIINRWDVVKKNGFADFLKSTTTRFMPSRLDSSVTALLQAIQESVTTFCLPVNSTYIPLNPELLNVLVDVQAHVRYNLADYGDYLRVKSMRNVTLTSYMTEFPDLIHFIYVNRSNNQLMVPSLDEVAKMNNSNIARRLKHKIIKMIEFTRNQLQCGHFAVTWRDNQFQYSYFLWFEDLKGKPLKPQIMLQGLRNFPSPGCLCGDFFKLLRAECFPNEQPENIQCYELLCMHNANTTSNSIDQIKKLLSAIWESIRANHDGDLF